MRVRTKVMDDEEKECTHLDHIHIIDPGQHICQGCSKTGASWLQLRMCLECGYIGCCDSSEGKHATAHFKESGHPLIRSVENHWIWCYVDDRMVGQVHDYLHGDA